MLNLPIRDYGEAGPSTTHIDKKMLTAISYNPVRGSRNHNTPISRFADVVSIIIRRRI